MENKMLSDSLKQLTEEEIREVYSLLRIRLISLEYFFVGEREQKEIDTINKLLDKIIK